MLDVEITVVAVDAFSRENEKHKAPTLVSTCALCGFDFYALSRLRAASVILTTHVACGFMKIYTCNATLSFGYTKNVKLSVFIREI